MSKKKQKTHNDLQNTTQKTKGLSDTKPTTNQRWTLVLRKT